MGLREVISSVPERAGSLASPAPLRYRFLFPTAAFPAYFPPVTPSATARAAADRVLTPCFTPSAAGPPRDRPGAAVGSPWGRCVAGVGRRRAGQALPGLAGARAAAGRPGRCPPEAGPVSAGGRAGIRRRPGRYPQEARTGQSQGFTSMSRSG